MQSSYLTEMESVDGKCNCQGEQAWTPEQSPEKEPPVLDAFDAAEPQLVNGSPQSQDILWLQLDSDFGWLVLTKKCQNARVIEFWCIDLFKDFAVAFPQRFQTHLGDDIGRAIHVIT